MKLMPPNDPDAICRLNLSLARAYTLSGRFDKAQTTILEILKVRQLLSDDNRDEGFMRRIPTDTQVNRDHALEKIMTYEALGEYFLCQFDYVNAKAYLETALKLYKFLTIFDLGNLSIVNRRAFQRLRLAQVLLRLNDPKTAYKLAQLSYTHFYTYVDQPQRTAEALGVLGEIEGAEGKHAEAQSKFMKAISIFESVYGSEHVSIADILVTMGRTFTAPDLNNLLTKRHELLLRAYHFYKKMNMKNYKSLLCVHGLAVVTFAMKQEEQHNNYKLIFKNYAAYLLKQSPNLKIAIDPLCSEIENLGSISQLPTSKKEGVTYLMRQTFNPERLSMLYRSVGPLEIMPMMYKQRMETERQMAVMLGRIPPPAPTFEQAHPGISRYLSYIRKLTENPESVPPGEFAEVRKVMLKDIDEKAGVLGASISQKMREYILSIPDPSEGEPSEAVVLDSFKKLPFKPNEERMKFNARFFAENGMQRGHLPRDTDILDQMTPDESRICEDVPTLMNMGMEQAFQRGELDDILSVTLDEMQNLETRPSEESHQEGSNLEAILSSTLEEFIDQEKQKEYEFTL